MLERLNAHREWANHRIIEWYLALPQGEEYCLKMLSHILLGEETWSLRLHGGSNPETARMLTAWDLLPPDELLPRSEANNAAWREVLRSDLSRRIRYVRFAGDACESVLADIVSHVSTHAQYHRGQIAAQAARAGLKCPPTDFIVFARLSDG